MSLKRRLWYEYDLDRFGRAPHRMIVWVILQLAFMVTILQLLVWAIMHGRI